MTTAISAQTRAGFGTRTDGFVAGNKSPASTGLALTADTSGAPGDTQEQERLAALDRYDVLDTPREEAFDRITRLIKKLLDVPIAHVSMLDGHRQWFKSCEGFNGSEAPRRDTFCNRTIQNHEPLVVSDAASDPRFSQNPYVLGEPHVRFYAGVPLTTDDGYNIGTLCAVDTKPRTLDPGDIHALSDLARMVMDELELRRLVSVDSLTGAMSRRAFKEEGSRMLALALRHHHDLSCIALDLDHFKRVNDTYGHASGDTVLVGAVKACFDHVRQTDIIGRLGGEEFAILMPHTGASGALGAGEKLRSAIESLRFEMGGTAVGLTASLGIASVDRMTTDFDTLLKHADAALYQAKSAGRNRSAAWQAPASGPATTRRRVLKGGQILFNGHTSSIDCTVRSLSEDGAGLDVSSSFGVPKRFDLAIKADDFQRACRVVAQAERHVEVEFC